jgi:hypothetical protein
MGAAGIGGGHTVPSAAQMREIAGLMQRLTKENALLIKARCEACESVAGGRCMQQHILAEGAPAVNQ